MKGLRLVRRGEERRGEVWRLAGEEDRWCCLAPGYLSATCRPANTIRQDWIRLVSDIYL